MRKQKTVKIDLDLESQSPNVLDTLECLYVDLELKRKEQKNALKLVLFNLFFYDYPLLITPRARKPLGPKRYNPLGVSYGSLTTVLDKLKTAGLTEENLGRKDLGTGKGLTTTTVATKLLKHGLSEDGWTKDDIIRSPDSEVILLRKRKNKQSDPKTLVDYDDNDHTNKMRKDLKKYNELLSKTDIWLLNPEMDEVQLDLGYFQPKRIFIQQGVHEPDGTDTFTFGGRMYAPWCDLSKNQRKRIWINDEQTAELDFPSSHVNVMYKVITGKPYGGSDAYRLTVDGIHIPRHIVKQLSSIMLNVASIKSAVNALRSSYQPKDIDVKDIKKSKTDKATEYLSIIKQVPPSRIAREYLKKHNPIQWFFLKDKLMGAHVQFWEADLVMNIINKLTRKNIPCLTIYDSFIVQQKHKEELEVLMKKVKPSKRIKVN